MVKVYSDKHGIYIKSGGYIARPIPSRFSPYLKTLTTESRFKAGDKVKAYHVGGTELHKVRSEDNTDKKDYETWCGHGCYFDKPNSEDNFDPRIERPKNQEVAKLIAERFNNPKIKRLGK